MTSAAVGTAHLLTADGAYFLAADGAYFGVPVSWIAGRQIQVRLYSEAIYAIPPASAFGFPAYFSAWSVAPTAALRTIDILSAGRTPLIARSPSTLAGTVETVLAPETIGWWLFHAMGKLTTTGSGPYTHTFTPGALPTGFTAEKAYPDGRGYERQSGLKVASATFAFAPGDSARLTINLQGARQTLADTQIEANDTIGTARFLTADGTYFLTSDGAYFAAPATVGQTDWIGSDIAITQDGAALGTVTSIALILDNALASTSMALCGKPYGPPAGRIKLSARVQAVLTDHAWLEQAMSEAVTDFAVAMTHGSGNGSTGNESLILTMQDCQINPYSPAIDTESGLIADLSIQIGTLTATLRNSLASVLP